ncbi:isoprenylcysteine carboxylmethyltransferase family protein [Cryobacterium luteum]|uniref:Isoprenylcysteine carboxylmethyltransferase family protein n=2 Tax=Cryobacterium luteum TaxID=1424661 RepID=A0A5F0D8X5_9MICO|nr:isoprenylcysteine carboxylmethyltransferase family protein [Cryobacterium luteum]
MHLPQQAVASTRLCANCWHAIGIETQCHSPTILAELVCSYEGKWPSYGMSALTRNCFISLHGGDAPLTSIRALPVRAYPQTMKRALALSLVAGQFLLLGALVFLPHGSLWSTGIGVIVAAIALGLVGAALAVLGVVGLGPALTASPIPRERAPLITSGVYGLMRSPIYAGLMTGGVALVLVGASAWHVVVWIALVALLSVKTRWEERMLVAEHPEYRSYGARAGRFLPGVGRLAERG